MCNLKWLWYPPSPHVFQPSLKKCWQNVFWIPFNLLGDWRNFLRKEDEDVQFFQMLRWENIDKAYKQHKETHAGPKVQLEGRSEDEKQAKLPEKWKIFGALSRKLVWSLFLQSVETRLNRMWENHPILARKQIMWSILFYSWFLFLWSIASRHWTNIMCIHLRLEIFCFAAALLTAFSINSCFTVLTGGELGPAPHQH